MRTIVIQTVLVKMLVLNDPSEAEGRHNHSV